MDLGNNWNLFFAEEEISSNYYVFIQIGIQLKTISKIFVNYRPERRCPLCEATISEDSNYCPSCGYIVHKDLWGTEDIVEFSESEEYDVKNSDINAAYRRIEEEIIDGIA